MGKGSTWSNDATEHFPFPLPACSERAKLLGVSKAVNKLALGAAAAGWRVASQSVSHPCVLRPSFLSCPLDPTTSSSRLHTDRQAGSTLSMLAISPDPVVQRW